MSDRNGPDDSARYAIVAEGLTKTFHHLTRRRGFIGGLTSLIAPRVVAHTAVENVSIAVRRGELLALLGPNGAGKSTTIKMLTGILRPSAGSVRVAGLDPHRQREQNARNIGAVFGQRTQLWWDLPVRDSLSILRDIYEIRPVDFAQRLRDFDRLLELSRFWDTRVRHLSLGQRVRADMAAALLHDPRIVFLDEPTIGMDVVVKDQVREFLRFEVEQRGRTVLLTTHDMTEVSRLAKRIMLINNGRVVFDGSTQELSVSLGRTWQVSVTLAEQQEQLSVPGVQVLRRDGRHVTFGPLPPNRSADPADGAEPVASPQEAVRRIVERYVITSMTIDESDLEDVMRQAFVQQRPSLAAI